MTKIIYKINDGIGEAREFFGEGLTLTISVNTGTDGYITLSGTTKKLSDGEARFNLERVPDGDYTPILDGSCYAVLEPIRKIDGKIFPLSPSNDSLRRLFRRTERCEENIERLEKILDELNRKLDGRIIF